MTGDTMSPSRTTDYGMLVEPVALDTSTDRWTLTADAHESVAKMLANTVDFYVSMTQPSAGVRVTLRLEAL